MKIGEKRRSGALRGLKWGVSWPYLQAYTLDAAVTCWVYVSYMERVG